MASALMKPRFFKGLTITPLAYTESEVNCTVTLPGHDLKAVLRGKLCFERHEGSHTYEDEVIINVWSQEPPTIKRSNVEEGTWRLEVPVELHEFYYTICETKRQLETHFRKART